MKSFIRIIISTTYIITLIEINNINTRTELEEIIKFSTKCLEKIKCQLTEGEVYTNV